MYLIINSNFFFVNIAQTFNFRKIRHHYLHLEIEICICMYVEHYKAKYVSLVSEGIPSSRKQPPSGDSFSSNRGHIVFVRVELIHSADIILTVS